MGRTTRSKNKRRVRRLFTLRKQRGGALTIEEWIARLKDQPAFPYKVKPQESTYELVSLKSENLTIPETGPNDTGDDFSRLAPSVFAEKTMFYNVAKDVAMILQNVLVQGVTPNEFREHITSMKQTGQTGQPGTQAIAISQSLNFLADIETAMRDAAKMPKIDNDILTNEEAYPLFIWAMGINVTVGQDDPNRPILFPKAKTQEQGLEQQQGQPPMQPGPLAAPSP